MNINYGSIKILNITVEATVGSNINECLRDAMSLSLDQTANIVLIHNDKKYKVTFNDLMTTYEAPEEAKIL